jgi:hypothetical protein
MRHSSTKKVYTMKTRSLIFEGLQPIPQWSLSASETWETKERIAASHFGFGVQMESLSARQLAILSALGLSRISPNKRSR